MSDSATTEQATEQSQEDAPSDNQQPETFDTEYVSKLRKENAKYRTEAKANAEAAKKLATIEEAQKSEAEKAADRIAKAEAEASTVPAKVADALKAHLVALHEFDEEDAELFLTATEPELLLKQVTRLLGQSDKRQKKNHVPREGENPSAASTDEATFARDLLSG